MGNTAVCVLHTSVHCGPRQGRSTKFWTLYINNLSKGPSPNPQLFILASLWALLCTQSPKGLVCERFRKLQSTIRPVGYLRRQDHVIHQINLLHFMSKKVRAAFNFPKT